MINLNITITRMMGSYHILTNIKLQTKILTPFSVVAGVIGFGANTIASPVLALFKKGDTLYLRSGSDFEIKLLQDVFIYN